MGCLNPYSLVFLCKLGNSIDNSVYSTLSSNEKNGLADAAAAIYQTYKMTIDSVEKTGAS